MKLSPSRLWPLAASFFALASANAAPISYEAQAVSGSTWQYNYIVGNDDAADAIYEFTIFFDLGLYSNLRLATAPTDWDSIAIQPDPNLPDDGFYDALALDSPISQGELLGGFSIVFDYLGLGTPGSQRYSIVDPNDFATISSGQTRLLAPTSTVPEPSVIALILMSLGAATLARRKSRRVGRQP